jgi:hypothetical protein
MSKAAPASPQRQGGMVATGGVSRSACQRLARHPLVGTATGETICVADYCVTTTGVPMPTRP